MMKGKLYLDGGGNLAFAPDGGEPTVIAEAAGPYVPSSRAAVWAGRLSLAARAAWAALRGRNVEVDARGWLGGIPWQKNETSTRRS